MATNPPGQAFPNKARVAILAELEKERRRLLNTPGASISLSRPNLKEFRDNAEQQHIAAQQKAALQHAHTHSSGFFITQDSSFGNLILPVIPRLEPESWPFYRSSSSSCCLWDRAFKQHTLMSDPLLSQFLSFKSLINGQLLCKQSQGSVNLSFLHFPDQQAGCWF